MFTPFDHEDATLDEAIASAYLNLAQHTAESEEYAAAVNQISKLYALKNQSAQLNLQAQQSAASQQLANEQAAASQQLADRQQQLAEDQNAWSEERDELPFLQRIDPNTLVTVAGNLLIGLLVIKYEQTGVISSKVMSFMKKI